MENINLIEQLLSQIQWVERKCELGFDAMNCSKNKSSRKRVLDDESYSASTGKYDKKKIARNKVKV